jgi:hypothetical protein
VGIAALYSAPWWLQTFLPPAAAKSFVFNPDFLLIGGAVVGALYLLDAMLFAVVFLDGRWRQSTRVLDIVTTLFWTAVMLWLILVPRIFLSPTTDQATKDWIGFVLLIVIVCSIPKFLRAMRRS